MTVLRLWQQVPRNTHHLVCDQYNLHMQSLLQDVRFGVRMLRKNAGFTVAATLILALGVGANTAMFTVINALLLRPFPYRDPQKLVAVTIKDKSGDRSVNLVRYESLRDHNQSFESIEVWANDNMNFTGRGEPLQLAVARVSPNFFRMLGVQAKIGRGFSEDEGRPEGKPVAIISNSLWRSRFGSDRSIVGQSVTLDTVPYTVIGVLPAGLQFAFVGEAEVWIPRYFEFSLMSPQQLRSGVGYLGMVARLRPGTTPERAQADLDLLKEQYRKQNPKMPDADPGVVTTATPLRDLVVSDVRIKALVLSGAVVLVLMIACGNVATLLLSRALARRKEIAVRSALGASRRNLVQQLLTESIVLAFLAGTLGLGLGWLAMGALRQWGVEQLPQGIPIAMDLSAISFAAGISVLTGLLFGSFPAFQISRADLSSTLRDEARGVSEGHARVQLKSLLVVGQIALSLLLLIAAGLLLRSFSRLVQVDPGFVARNVLTMNVSLPSSKYVNANQQTAFFDELLRRVSILPGVRSAAISAALPLHSIRITPVLPEGQPIVPLAQRPFIDIEAISPQWFETMEVPLRRGRRFTVADNAQTAAVVIVNQAFARRFWPNQNPLGKTIIVGRRPAPAEVIGIASDVKNQGLAEETQAQLYLPFPQLPWGDMNLLVRTAIAPRSMIHSVRAQVTAIDPDQPVMDIQTVDDLMDSSRAQPRFTFLLLSAFSASALLLTLIGIYGLLTYSVSQRRQELGIRFALGAEQSDILRLVVGQGFRLAGVGACIGFAAALLLTQLLSTMLYKISAWDTPTFLLTTLLFLSTALLACYLPARRAAQVNPLEALREG